MRPPSAPTAAASNIRAPFWYALNVSNTVWTRNVVVDPFRVKEVRNGVRMRRNLRKRLAARPGVGPHTAQDVSAHRFGRHLLVGSTRVTKCHAPARYR